MFQISNTFPKEEKYSLTDQVRRSSRSICANLAEGYAKRIYPAHFVAKASDADMENNETKVWLEFARTCDYIDQRKYEELINISTEVGKMINTMIKCPDKFR